jgi:hypothetical protein
MKKTALLLLLAPILVVGLTACKSNRSSASNEVPKPCRGVGAEVCRKSRYLLNAAQFAQQSDQDNTMVGVLLFKNNVPTCAANRALLKDRLLHDATAYPDTSIEDLASSMAQEGDFNQCGTEPSSASAAPAPGGGTGSNGIGINPVPDDPYNSPSTAQTVSPAPCSLVTAADLNAAFTTRSFGYPEFREGGGCSYKGYTTSDGNIGLNVTVQAAWIGRLQQERGTPVAGIGDYAVETPTRLSFQKGTVEVRVDLTTRNTQRNQHILHTLGSQAAGRFYEPGDTPSRAPVPTSTPCNAQPGQASSTGYTYNSSLVRGPGCDTTTGHEVDNACQYDTGWTCPPGIVADPYANYVTSPIPAPGPVPSSPPPSPAPAPCVEANGSTGYSC